MKKLLSLVLFAAAIFCLTSCSSPDQGKSNTTSASLADQNTSMDSISNTSQNTENSITDTGQTAAASDSTWETIDAKISEGLFDVIWDGARFISAGEGIILSSADGLVWETEYKGEYIFTNIACNNKKYVASAIQQGFIPFVLISDDLKEWEKISLDDFGTQANSTVYSVAYGQDGFVAVGTNGRYAVSEDGEKWTTNQYLIGNGSLLDVIYTGKWWIACGNNGSLVISEDSNNWQLISAIDNVPAGEIPAFSRMDFGPRDSIEAITIMGDKKGHLYIIDPEQVACRRLDETHNPFFETSVYSTIDWTDEGFYAVNDNGIIHSVDGNIWEKVDIGYELSWGINSLTSNSNVVVAVGMFGKIIVKHIE